MAERRVGPDSRTRTHLANERTLLARLRTAVTMIALGLAAAQFLTRDLVLGVPLAAGIAIALAVGGVFFALVGVHRYYRTTRRIEEGTFRPASLAVVASALLFVVLGSLAIIFILVVRP